MELPQRPEVAPRPVHARRYRRLDSKERAGALVAGVLVLATAFLAVFLTENEAGPAVAILLAGVLLVMGIQGTQLGGLGKDQASFIPTEEPEIVANVARQITDAGSPETAGQLLGAYESANPDAGESPAILGARSYAEDAASYERRVIDALSAVDAESFLPSFNANGAHVDARMNFPGGVTIIVEAKHFGGGRPVRRADVDKALALATRVGARGALIVTDTEVPRGTIDAIRDTPAEIVTWRDEDDNPRLHQAIRRLVQKLST